jgi:hypothetical protein
MNMAKKTDVPLGTVKAVWRRTIMKAGQNSETNELSAEMPGPSTMVRSPLGRSCSADNSPKLVKRPWSRTVAAFRGDEHAWHPVLN